MSRRTVLRAPLVAALVAGLASASSAAEADDARRLDDLHYFVKELRRGYEPLLADAELTIDARSKAQAPDVRRVREAGDGIRETVAKVRLGKGESGEAGALELYE